LSIFVRGPQAERVGEDRRFESILAPGAARFSREARRIRWAIDTKPLRLNESPFMEIRAMKTYVPVLALLVVNVGLVVGVRARSNPPAARPSLELLNQVVNLRPPLRRPARAVVDPVQAKRALSPTLEPASPTGLVVQSEAGDEHR
jgi:hypothetical protein